jgi:4'-phosphopantetheinyl transferase
MLEERSCLIVAVPLVAPIDEVQQAFDCLNEDERARSARFLTADLRRRFTVCRGRLRMLLASILDTSPQRIDFEYGSLGKPYVVSDIDLQFNVSHSQDWALMAFTKGSPVGVDIEFYDRRMNDEAIASQLLSESEFVKWSSLPKDQQSSSLISAWVSKEAILKSLGLGITTSLRQLELPIPLPMEGLELTIGRELIAKAEATMPRSSEKTLNFFQWSLRFIDIVPDACAAVAYTAQSERYTILPWSKTLHLS